jgi:glycerol-1-phosphate dehydrogenase [NAD(P)+]
MYTIINSVEDYLTRDSTGLANSQIDCPYCGQQHIIPIQKILTGDGLLAALPELAGEALGRPPTKPGLIYDRAIEGLIQDQVIAGLESCGMPVTPAGIGQPGQLVDLTLELAEGVAANLDVDFDILIGAGSGVISDLTKWVADKTGKPFILYATAPSMNAHASITTVITVESFKTSFLVEPAYAVVFDLPLLGQAPLEMLQAGIGDLTARAICNADWKLSNRLRNTYFCPLPYQLTAANETRYLGSTGGVRARQPEAIRNLSEATLVSALSMSMLSGGETAPSSGAEHIISHYWDLMAKLEGLPKNLHGAQVGIATVLSMTLHDYMRKLDPSNIDPEKLLRNRPSLPQIESENKRRYGAKAKAFNKAVRHKWVPDGEYIAYVERVLFSWQELWADLEPYSAPPEYIRQPLEAAGMQASLDTVRRSRAQALDALLYSHRYRTRYTILDLAWELGVFPEAAPEVLDLSGLV